MISAPFLPASKIQQRPPIKSPMEALQYLVEGNRRFANRTAQRPNQTVDRLSGLGNGQNPFATVLSCSDSRVPPEIIFDQGIGDLFIIRVAGNVVSPTEMGSSEYGVSVLNTKVLLVLGHLDCGAVKAALNNQVGAGHIGSLLEAIQPAVAASEGCPGDRLQNAVQANVLAQTEQLLSSAAICERLDSGSLNIVGAYFDICSGNVEFMHVITNSSVSIRPNSSVIF